MKKKVDERVNVPTRAGLVKAAVPIFKYEKRPEQDGDFPSYMITDDNVLYVAYKNASAKNDGGGLGSFSIVHGDLILVLFRDRVVLSVAA